MGDHRIDSLTVRERECLRLVARDRDSGQIANALKIGTETVETHIKRARQKLGGITRFEAARALAETESRPHPMVTPALGIDHFALPAHSALTEESSLVRGEAGVDEATAHVVHRNLPDTSPLPQDEQKGTRNALSALERLGRVGTIAARITAGFATLMLAVFLLQEIAHRLNRG